LQRSIIIYLAKTAPVENGGVKPVASPASIIMIPYDSVGICPPSKLDWSPNN